MPALIDLATAPAALRAGVLALNAEVEAATSPLSAARLDALLAEAVFARAIAGPGPGGVAAFLIGLGPGAAYDSPNYRWFAARFARFAYIDRVAVAASARGGGLGRALYAAFAAAAAPAGLQRLACEVNIEPPNPGSDAFHAALGFAEAGRGAPAPGRAVRYLVRGLGAGAAPGPD
jgi:predicted GNAT superfamily acetyltransferase